MSPHCYKIAGAYRKATWCLWGHVHLFLLSQHHKDIIQEPPTTLLDWHFAQFLICAEIAVDISLPTLTLLISHFSYSDIDYSHFSYSDIDAALSADIDSILDWHQHGLLPLFHAPWPYSQQNPPPWLFPIHSHCVWCRRLDILRHAPDLPQSQEKAITTSVLGYKRDANPRKIKRSLATKEQSHFWAKVETIMKHQVQWMIAILWMIAIQWMIAILWNDYTMKRLQYCNTMKWLNANSRSG